SCSVHLPWYVSSRFHHFFGPSQAARAEYLKAHHPDSLTARNRLQSFPRARLFGSQNRHIPGRTLRPPGTAAYSILLPHPERPYADTTVQGYKRNHILFPSAPCDLYRKVEFQRSNQWKFSFPRLLSTLQAAGFACAYQRRY